MGLFKLDESVGFNDIDNNDITAGTEVKLSFQRSKDEELKSKGKELKLVNTVGENLDNMLIEGDNYSVMQYLQKTESRRIKLIYMDPPYNTQSTDFSYQDKMDRVDWLNFMYNRLEVARDLLADDGAIYVQTDFHEIHYLKVLMDEIFGEANFQREIIWRIGWLSGYKTAVNNWVRNHDTILFYAKYSSKLQFKKHYLHPQDFRRPPVSDIERYPIDDVWNGNEYDDLNSIAIMSFAGETVSKLLDNPELSVKGQKPEKLLDRIISAHTIPGDIVLDPFGGSGTTAAACLKMKRNFITIESLPEHVDIIEQRLNKVIEGDQSGISRKYSWYGGGGYSKFVLQ